MDEGKVHKKKETFGKVFAALMHDTSITDFAVRLYAHMHWRWGGNQDNHEGQRSMAEFLDRSPRTIGLRVQELEAAGWLVVENRPPHPKTGNFQTPFYHLFEDPNESRAFRRTYKPPVGHTLREVTGDISGRKSRKGKGGFTDATNRYTAAAPEKRKFVIVSNLPRYFVWDRLKLRYRANLDSSGHRANLDSPHRANPDSYKPDSIDPDSSSPKNKFFDEDSDRPQNQKTGEQEKGNSSSAPAATTGSNPTGLYKTKLYPISLFERLVHDDPFNSEADFTKAQGRHNCYPGLEMRKGQAIMSEGEFVGWTVTKPAKRYGSKKGTRREPPAPESDPLYHLVAKLWDLNPQVVGRVYQIRHFVTGTAQKGEWGAYALDPGMTEAELKAYKLWRDEVGRMGLDMPQKPDQIQKSVIEFRESPQYRFYLHRFEGAPTADTEPVVEGDRTQLNDGVHRTARSRQVNHHVETMPIGPRINWKLSNGYTHDDLTEEERSYLAVKTP